MKIFLGLFIFFVLFICLAGSVAVVTYGEPGSGVSKTETRELDSFSRISLEEIGTVNVSLGATQSVTVTTDDNLLELVETTVEDNKLKIRTKKALNPKINLVIQIVVPELTAADLAGMAVINVTDFSGDSFNLELNGACGATMSGTVNELDVELNGACRASLRELKANSADVELNGTGTATVYASQSIDAAASGMGSIVCYGNPDDVEKEANGISRVKIVKD